jgi:hypothetical protein
VNLAAYNAKSCNDPLRRRESTALAHVDFIQPAVTITSTSITRNCNMTHVSGTSGPMISSRQHESRLQIGSAMTHNECERTDTTMFVG